MVEEVAVDAVFLDLDHKVHLALMEKMVPMENLELLGEMGQMHLRPHQLQKLTGVSNALMLHQDQQAILVQKDLLDELVLLEKMQMVEPEDPLGHRDHKVPLALVAHLDPRGIQAPQDWLLRNQDPMGHQDLLDLQDHLAQMDHLEPMEIPGEMDHQDLQETQAEMDHQASQGPREKTVLKASVDHQEHATTAHHPELLQVTKQPSFELLFPDDFLDHLGVHIGDPVPKWIAFGFACDVPFL